MMKTRLLEHRMTTAYIVGLIVIGILASVSTYVMYRVVDSESIASQIYDNLSAQQNRVQRIALLTVAIAERESESNAPKLKEELKLETLELLTNHRQLVDDLREKMGFKWSLTQGTQKDRAKFRSYQALDRELKNFAANAKYLGRLDDMPTEMDDMAVKVVLQKANSQLMTMLADLHEGYQASHESKKSRYRQVLGLNLGILLLVLILEGLFLFRPLVKIIKREHDAIIAAKEKADTANKVKTEFLANVSHEIRTPLTAIIGFSDMILSDSKLDSDLRQKNNTIRQSAVFLKTMIDDFLDFTKAHESHIDFHVESVRLEAVLQEVSSILSVRCQEKKLSFAIVYENSIPTFLKCDTNRLKQILFNLIGNAIKFTIKGGITVTVAYDLQDPGLTIKIIDTGVGISNQDRDRIFGRFVQVDSSMTRTETGSGIGLSLSQLICRAWGGSLVLADTSPQGSTFKVNLPLKPDGDSRTKCFEVVKDDRHDHLSKENIANFLKDVRILIVEDGKENREIYSYFLGHAGASIDLAENGQIGLDKARTSSYDVILMDIQMPIMDGYTAAAEIIKAGIQVPIIALTAHALKSEQEKCAALGFSDYLAKPVAIPTLLDKIADWSNRVQSLAQPNPAKDGTGSTQTGPTKVLSIYHHDEMYQPMIVKFCSNLAERERQILATREANDWSQLEKLAHKIKGAGASYGYRELSEISGRIESLAKKIASQPSADAIADIDKVIVTFISLLRDIELGADELVS